MSNDTVIVEPCGAPPVQLARHQSAEGWFRYQVATASGRGDATGYAPGPETNAMRAAYAALNALQRAEGAHVTKLPRALTLHNYKQRTWGRSQTKKTRAPRKTLAGKIAADVARVQANTP